jgi:hypothetical protein
MHNQNDIQHTIMKKKTTKQFVHQNHNIKFPSCKICSLTFKATKFKSIQLMDMVEHHHKRPMKKLETTKQKTIDKNDIGPQM